MSQVTEETAKPNTSLMIRGAIWVAIGAMIAAALVCVVWVLIGNQDGIIGRAFLTVLLLAAFAGIAILEAGLAPGRPDWLTLTSMITWIIALIAGAIKIWLPEESYEFDGFRRFFMFLLIVGVLQLGLLHVRLFTQAARRYVTPFTRGIYYATIGLLVLLVAMLVIYLTLPDTFEYGDMYWRIVVALAILTAVGTTLIPLLNALFAPKKRESEVRASPYAPVQSYAATPAGPQYESHAQPVAGQQQWPTYADGVTPLPVLVDGSPDWNAYYTGIPTQQQAQGMPQPVFSEQTQFPEIPQFPAAAPTGEHFEAFAPEVTEASAVDREPESPEPVPDVAPAVPDAATEAPEVPPPAFGPPPAVPGAFPPPPPAPR